MRSVGNPPAVNQAGECPLLSGDDIFRTILVILHRQHRFPTLQVVGRVGLMVPVGQKLHIGRRGRLEGNHDATGHRRSVSVDGVGNIATQQARGVGHVVLPDAPDQAVSVAHHEAVARVRVGVGRRIGRAVDVLQRQLLAAIEHIEQQSTVTVVGVHRLDDAEVCRKLHVAFRVARRQRDVRNGGILRIGRVRSEMRHAVQLLVSAHIAECLAIGEWPSAR